MARRCRARYFQRFRFRTAQINYGRQPDTIGQTATMFPGQRRRPNGHLGPFEALGKSLARAVAGA